MANVTIPNLPQVTATTDLDILVITDSGETTTSKITKSDFLSGIGGGNLIPGTGTNSYTTTGNETKSTKLQSLFLGPAATGTGRANGDYSIALTTLDGRADGNRSIVAAFNGLADGYAGSIFGTDNGYVGASNSTVVGGWSNSILSGQYNGIFAGYSNEIKNGYGQVIVGGNGNIIYGNSDSQFSLGSQSVRLNATNNNSKALAVVADQVSVCIDSGWGAIISSYQCGINGAGTYNEQNLKIDGQHQLILNSRSSYMTGTTVAGADYSSIISSSNCKIGDNVDYVNIIGCQNYEADTSNVVVVPGMVITNYSTLNYADDTAAAAGGVPLGGVYHNAGDLRIRIS